MSIELSGLSEDHLFYLKQKWLAQVKELELNHDRATKRLALRLKRRDTEAEDLAALATSLQTAESLLEHLQNTSAPSDLVAAQQAQVDILVARYQTEATVSGTFTDAEAVLQQATIDELAYAKSYRETKISEIDALLNP